MQDKPSTRVNVLTKLHTWEDHLKILLCSRPLNPSRSTSELTETALGLLSAGICHKRRRKPQRNLTEQLAANDAGVMSLDTSQLTNSHPLLFFILQRMPECVDTPLIDTYLTPINASYRRSGRSLRVRTVISQQHT